MNEMPVRPIHDVMFIGYARTTNPSQGGLYSNQVTI